MEIIDLNHTNKLETALWDAASAASEAQEQLVILDNRLLTLRLSAGKLRAAVERAFAPLTAAAAPVLEGTVKKLTDFCNDAGAVMAALFGTVQKKVVTTTKASGAAIRRTLADFDQLQRLGGKTGGGSTETQVTLQPINDPLTPQLQAIVDKIKAFMDKIKSLIAPLKDIDLQPAAESLRSFGSAIGELLRDALPRLEGFWHSVLVPLATWVIQEAVPASVNALTAALSGLHTLCQPVLDGFGKVIEGAKPLAQLLGSTLVQGIEAAKAAFSQLQAIFMESRGTITAAFSHVVEAVGSLTELLRPILAGLQALWQGQLSSLVAAASGLVNSFSGILLGLAQLVSGVFSGNWSKAWEGVKTTLRSAANSIISLLNGLLSGLTGVVNGIAATLNGFDVTVPKWVPGLGGKTFGFQLPTVTAPSIPYLASGAVLPANKPFLAMVGDQRHGTNIEAPLSTIEEAVAGVMENQTGAILAGFSASVEVQRQILQAVLGIHIGDETIAAAYSRSYDKLAMQRGV